MYVAALTLTVRFLALSLSLSRSLTLTLSLCLKDDAFLKHVSCLPRYLLVIWFSRGQG